MTITSHSLRYLFTLWGRSLICPVVISDIPDMNKNAKGSAADAFPSGASKIRIMPQRLE